MKRSTTVLLASLFLGAFSAFAQGTPAATPGVNKKQIEQACMKEGKKRGTEAFSECVKSKSH